MFKIIERQHIEAKLIPDKNETTEFVYLALFVYTQSSLQAAFEWNLMLCANAKPLSEQKHMKKQKAWAETAKESFLDHEADTY